MKLLPIDKPPGFYRLPLDRALVDRLRGVPGIIWNADATGILINFAKVPRNVLRLLDDMPEARGVLAHYDTRPHWEERDAEFEGRGIKFRTAQQQAIDFITMRRGILLGDDMRVGKGHPIHTTVLTPSGWCPIGALAVGREVFGSDGRPYKVTGVYPRGRLETFRVTFNDGASVDVDGDHLWSVWDHNAWHRGQPRQTKSTRELCGDLTYANGNRKWRIPMVAPIEFPVRKQLVDPYILGVLLGDGSLTTGSITFTPGDELVPMEVAKRLPRGVRLVRHVEQPGKAACWGLSREAPSGPNPLLEALRRLEVCHRSEDKFVPTQYVMASVEQRLALLRGLMDTDGELRADGYVGFSSASRALADAVAFIVKSLGGCAREMKAKLEPKYTHNGGVRVGLPSYRLSISMPAGVSPFLARPGYVDRRKYLPVRTIASIEPVGDAEVVCISVDAPDQLYVTEHCIVTHNTLSCVASHDPKTGPLVVIAPLSTRAVWLGWMRRVFPDLPIGVSTGRKFDIETFRKPLVFTHYDIVQHWQAIFSIGTLVLDEAHMLSNPDAKRTKACQMLAQSAKRVIAATGTPVWNRPTGVWALLQLIMPGSWGTYYDFANRYGNPQPTAYGRIWEGISNEGELNARMADVMIRRRWIDVASDIPAISRTVAVAEVSQTEQKRLDILAAKLKTERTNTAANLAAYRRQITHLKLTVTCDEAEKILSRNESVVIWTWHRDFAEQIAAKFEHAFVIHGEIHPDERERRIQAWRDCETPAVLVATMAVGQVGIDLSHARFAIFAEIDYIPAVIGQAEMRTFAATRAMFITFIVANHVVDQRIVRALVSKLSSADPLGVAAARDSIDALREAVMGPEDHGDLDRLLEDLLASAA